MPLDRFQVTLTPGDAAAFVSCLDDENLVSRWSLFDWRPAEQYAGAIAIYGREWRVHKKTLALLGLGF